MSAPTRPCEICRQPIDPERIEVIPETRLCTTHAQQIVKYGGEFIVTAIQERTSKAGSLKKNYGGVTPSRRRNYQALESLREEYANEKEQQQK